MPQPLLEPAPASAGAAVFDPMPDPLLPRIARGDQSAVPACLSRYAGLVWGLARRLLANPADAEDAAQEIFIDLWRNAGRFDPAVASEPTFVAMIARRRLIDRRRRGQRQPPPGPLPDTIAEPAPANAVDTADDAARAAAALGELREEQQQVIRMAVYQGLTHDQIAARTGLPLGTVKTHIRRGLQRVRERLDAGGER